MAYAELTSTINNLISESGNEWKNIPGGLDKVSESSMGAVWGIKAGQLYACLSPCKGNWVLQEFPDVSSGFKVLDFTTDDSLVYVLWNNSDTNITGMITKNGNNSGEWSRPRISPNINQIFNTSSYIWGQGTEKHKLAKPGTTGDWNRVPDTSGVKITSASSQALYGVAQGVAFKSDESLQTGWKQIPQFKGVFTGILGDADQSGIYGLDSQGQIQECKGDSCNPVPIMSPVNNLSPNPNTLWMTSQTQGNLGNIYMKDMTSPNIIKDVGPLDVERDLLVQETEKDYELSTYYNVMSKQLSEVKKMFQPMPAPAHPIDEKIVQSTSEKANSFETAVPFLFRGLIVLTLLILIYFCSGFLGVYTHYIALIVFMGGIYFVLNLNFNFNLNINGL